MSYESYLIRKKKKIEIKGTAFTSFELFLCDVSKIILK